MIVGTSTALVASVFTPIAFAKSFPDVPAGSSHEVSIDYLSDRNIVSGYTDGTFKPGRQLTRSDVVKMMGKYLVSEGNAIPSDYKTKMRFKDLSSSSSDELLQYAALVYDEGLFLGSNGNLMHKDPISRQQMAVVLNRLISERYGIADMSDLVDYAVSQGRTVKVTDLSEALLANRDDIEVIDLLGITNVTKFDPRGTTTRGQFASFLYRTLQNNFISKYVVDTVVSLNNALVAADGRSISFENVVAGTNIRVWNGKNQMLGEGTAGESGKLTIPLNPPLTASDTIKLEVKLPNGQITIVEFPSTEWNFDEVLGTDGPNNGPNPNPNPDEVAGTTELSNLIASANNAKVKTSTDNGATVPKNEKWTTPEALAALQSKIDAATAALNASNKTEASIKAASDDLTAALATYNAAKKDGFYNPNEVEGKGELGALVASAKDGIVKTSADGNDIITTEDWTTPAALQTFEAAIAAADMVYKDPNATKEQVAAAKTSLEAAIATYNAAKQKGKQAVTLQNALEQLKTALDNANGSKVKVSTNGGDVPSTEMWTTQAALDAFQSSITKADGVYKKENVTVTEVLAAKDELMLAKQAYEGAKKPGDQGDSSTLAALLLSSKDLIAKTKVAQNGSNLLKTENWNTQAEHTAFQNAINAVQQVYESTSATNQEVTNAKAALQAAYDQFNNSKQAGLLDAVTASDDIKSVALRYGTVTDDVSVGGVAVGGTTNNFNVLGIQLGPIGAELAGTLNSGFDFTVGQGRELTFTFRTIISGVLSIGDFDAGLYKKNANGNYELVAAEDIFSVSALGIPLQSNYDITFSDLTAGEYRIAVTKPGAVGLNLITGTSLQILDSRLEDVSDDINNAVATKTTTGAVTFSSGAQMTQVKPQIGETVFNPTAGVPIEGEHGRLSIDPTSGAYTYTSFGRVNSIGKVDKFEYEVQRGEEKETGTIYIRHNALNGSTVIPLRWDDAKPGDNAQLAVTSNIRRDYNLSASSMTSTTIHGSGSYTSTLDTTVNSNDMMVAGKTSIINFVPYSGAGTNGVTYDLVRKEENGAESVVDTIVVPNAPATGQATRQFTGHERGEYYIRATRTSGPTIITAIGVRGVTVDNPQYTPAKLDGTLFTTAANNTNTNLIYMAPGSTLVVGGTLVEGATTDVLGEYGTLKITNSGAYEYIPNELYLGLNNLSEVFQYRITTSDGQSVTGTINFTFKVSGATATVPSSAYSFSNTPAASTVDFKG